MNTFREELLASRAVKLVRTVPEHSNLLVWHGRAEEHVLVICTWSIDSEGRTLEGRAIQIIPSSQCTCRDPLIEMWRRVEHKLESMGFRVAYGGQWE